MYRKTITILLLLIFAVDCAGCSGVWRRKFVRKKKESKQEEPVLQPTDYKKEFSNKQLYANHYAFWKNSESELISSIKGERGQKRIDSYALYTEKEIQKLRELITDEKREEFKPLIDELKELISKITEAHYLSSHRNNMVRALTKHYRGVERDFSYFKMKKYIRPDDEKTQEPRQDNETTE